MQYFAESHPLASGPRSASSFPLRIIIMMVIKMVIKLVMVMMMMMVVRQFVGTGAHHDIGDENDDDGEDGNGHHIDQYLNIITITCGHPPHCGPRPP